MSSRRSRTARRCSRRGNLASPSSQDGFGRAQAGPSSARADLSQNGYGPVPLCVNAGLRHVIPPKLWTGHALARLRSDEKQCNHPRCNKGDSLWPDRMQSALAQHIGETTFRANYQITSASGLTGHNQRWGAGHKIKWRPRSRHATLTMSSSWATEPATPPAPRLQTLDMQRPDLTPKSGKPGHLGAARDAVHTARLVLARPGLCPLPFHLWLCKFAAQHVPTTGRT